jgi:hypothetical protein
MNVYMVGRDSTRLDLKGKLDFDERVEQRINQISIRNSDEYESKSIIRLYCGVELIEQKCPFHTLPTTPQPRPCCVLC